MVDTWELLGLLSRSPLHAKYGPARLRRNFEVPEKLGNMLTFRTPPGPLAGVLTWAVMSEEVEARWLLGSPLEPSDWNSGDRLWFIQFVAPYGGVHRMIRQVRHSPLFQNFKTARWGRAHAAGGFIRMGVANRELPKASGVG